MRTQRGHRCALLCKWKYRHISALGKSGLPAPQWTSLPQELRPTRAPSLHGHRDWCRASSLALPTNRGPEGTDPPPALQEAKQDLVHYPCPWRAQLAGSGRRGGSTWDELQQGSLGLRTRRLHIFSTGRRTFVFALALHTCKCSSARGGGGGGRKGTVPLS